MPMGKVLQDHLLDKNSSLTHLTNLVCQNTVCQNCEEDQALEIGSNWNVSSQVYLLIIGIGTIYYGTGKMDGTEKMSITENMHVQKLSILTLDNSNKF